MTTLEEYELALYLLPRANDTFTFGVLEEAQPIQPLSGYHTVLLLKTLHENNIPLPTLKAFGLLPDGIVSFAWDWGEYEILIVIPTLSRPQSDVGVMHNGNQVCFKYDVSKPDWAQSICSWLLDLPKHFTV